MSDPRSIDGVLVQWGDRLFYPGNRTVKDTPPRLTNSAAQRANAIHMYVMVLHDHQANPHVHISVRAESRHGSRLNPRKADLHRWRETFAEKLRGWGVDAEATRQSTRGQLRNYRCGI